MSIAASGAYASGSAKQTLQTLLSGLSSTKNATNASPASGASPTSSATADNALTGSPKASLSADILDVLMRIQQQNSSATDTAGSTSPRNSPLGQLFSIMAFHTNGPVSKSKLESYIQTQGGTASQADQLYALLNPNGTSATGALHQGQHHGLGGTPRWISQMASSMIQAINPNGDGSVSKSQMENFFNANGGTTSQADTVFAALDASGTGALSRSDFATALQNIQPGTLASNYARPDSLGSAGNARRVSLTA